MSTIKVDTVTTLDGTGNITLSRPLTGLSGSGASLTALNATQLTSGTVPDARFPSTLPAASGVNLTALNATNLASGTVPTARLGSGTANNGVFLRGDGTWNTALGSAAFQAYLTNNATNVVGGGTVYNITATAWTERFDVGSAFNTSNGTFTAPSTGKYLLSAVILVLSLIHI